MRLLALSVCLFGAVAFAQSSEPPAPVSTNGDEQSRTSTLLRLAKAALRANRAAATAVPSGVDVRTVDSTVSSTGARECMVYMPRAVVQSNIDKKMIVPTPKRHEETAGNGQRSRDTINPPVPECAPHADGR